MFLSLNTGTCVGLTRTAGSGKTTLIKSIMGMYGGDLEVPRERDFAGWRQSVSTSLERAPQALRQSDWLYPSKPYDCLFSSRKGRSADNRNAPNAHGAGQKASPKFGGWCFKAGELARHQTGDELLSRRTAWRNAPTDCDGLILGTRPLVCIGRWTNQRIGWSKSGSAAGTLMSYQNSAAILFISHDVEAMKALALFLMWWNTENHWNAGHRGAISSSSATVDKNALRKRPAIGEVDWKWTALSWGSLQELTMTLIETFCALDHASLIWEEGHSIAIMGEVRWERYINWLDDWSGRASHKGVF